MLASLNNPIPHFDVCLEMVGSNQFRDFADKTDLACPAITGFSKDYMLGPSGLSSHATFNDSIYEFFGDGNFFFLLSKLQQNLNIFCYILFILCLLLGFFIFEFLRALWVFCPCGHYCLWFYRLKDGILGFWLVDMCL